MITETNFKSLLLKLGFTTEGQIFSKYFPYVEAILKVDFGNKTLIYPEDKDKGMLINERQTCNFSAPENFVVFECVHRLLEKGYKPVHLELEPKWKLGHGASGGRADILVRGNNKKPLLIIECKTQGKEFEKAWKETFLDGDQLFSYTQQMSDVEFLCLYTSDWQNDELTYLSYIISHRDNTQILDDDKTLKSFKEANSVKERFKVWTETYKREYTTQGIFEKNIQPYHIGKDKYEVSDLRIVTQTDIQPKYHEFATILRQHNVSGRENAFDKLVNLFLCKIVDEKHNPYDLQFYWKGIAFDSYFELIDRLQRLYRDGMKQFLKEDVTYIDTQTIREAFKFFKNDPDATRDVILRHFRQQKYFTNSDFSFIDVHNEKLFYQNATVLLKIVWMIQDIQLNGDQQNQFLGDMFEFFLDQGFKQSEGQFFTPMPITRFILMSLPLETVIIKNEQPPKVIDYACGAGHFLTELATQIKPFVKKHKLTDIRKYYQNIYGIEKEYRLSKVAKVSAFMYNQDDINVIYADTLAAHEQITNDSFSILVANPPYSVKGFLETLPETDRDRFSLLRTINEKAYHTNNAIETFFIERAYQLMAPGGVAGIIVPSSILSNADSTYTATREILLKYFDIVAIVELGSGTFGKTGTNTVTLFLQRKDDNPAPADHYRCRVDAWFRGDMEKDVIFEDVPLLRKYCNHLEFGFDDYLTLLQGQPNDTLLAYDIFKEYHKDFDQSTEIKNLKRKGFFKDKNEAEQKAELEKQFLAYLKEIESKKLYYFLLAITQPQRVVVVKSPTDTKAQKEFLGYEWSAAKGSEGIKLATNEQGKHLTAMYDPDNRYNPEKINALIQENFTDGVMTVPESLQDYVTIARLVDMLDFSRRDFNKRISLVPRESIMIETERNWVRLSELMEIERGASPRPIEKFLTNDNNGINWIKIGDVSSDDKYITKTAEKITPEGAEKSRAVQEGDFILSNSMSFGRPYILKIAGCIHDGWLLMTNFDSSINKDYLYCVLMYEKIQRQFSEKASGVVVKNLNIEIVRNIKIPLPPKEVQEQIVTECDAIDEAMAQAQKVISETKKQIAARILSNDFPQKKLNNVAEKINDLIDPQTQTGEVIYIGLENIESNTGRLVGVPLTTYTTIKSAKNCFRIGDVLYGKLRPNLNKVYYAKQNGICSTDILVFRFENEYLAKFYSHYFLTKEFNNEVLKNISGQQLPRASWERIQVIKVPVPPLEIQQQLVAEITTLETKIQAAQATIDNAAELKQAVMRKYL